MRFPMRKHDATNGTYGSTSARAGPVPLQAGDRLTLDEFLRRWEEHPEIKRAELLGGIVYMPPSVTFLHGETEGDVAGFLNTYAAATEGVKHGTNSTTIMGGDSPQP